MALFEVGNRVICTAPYDGNDAIVGMVGVVCGPVRDMWCGVEYEDTFPKAHDCSGHCAYGYGWVTGYNCLQLYAEPDDEQVSLTMPYEELDI